MRGGHSKFMGLQRASRFIQVRDQPRVLHIAPAQLLLNPRDRGKCAVVDFR